MLLPVGVQWNGSSDAMNINYTGESESSVPLDIDVLERDDEDGSLAFGPNDVLSGRHKLSFNHSR